MGWVRLLIAAEVNKIKINKLFVLVNAHIKTRMTTFISNEAQNKQWLTNGKSNKAKFSGHKKERKKRKKKEEHKTRRYKESYKIT